MSLQLVRQIAEAMNLREPLKVGLEVLHEQLSTIDRHEPVSQILRKPPLRIQKPFSFDTEFPSFCFDIATGVGKTRLMGACIAYLYEKRISRNFFLLAPGQTIYDKGLISLPERHRSWLTQR